jgi:hypothetical protein
VERFLDRRQRSFGRIVHFFRVVGHLVVASRVTPAQDGPHQLHGAPRHDLAPRASACLVIVASLRDSPKKPRAAPPASILSACQIKENPAGNDLLIIVNGWIAASPIFCQPWLKRHCADNNEARLGPHRGVQLFAADNSPGWRIVRRPGRTRPP